jgi:hypothetical protein
MTLTPCVNPTQNPSTAAIDRDLRRTSTSSNSVSEGPPQPPRRPRAVDPIVLAAPPRPARGADLGSGAHPKGGSGSGFPGVYTSIFSDASAPAHMFNPAYQNVAVSLPVTPQVYNAPSGINNEADPFPEWTMGSMPLAK